MASNRVVYFEIPATQPQKLMSLLQMGPRRILAY
jgi:hypothetical protein